jgi:hypothetical protein
MLKLWSTVRRCPRCGSFNIHSHRGGSQFKRFIIKLVLMRKYSCLYCNSLYYGYLFSKRLPDLDRADKDPNIAMPIPKS